MHRRQMLPVVALLLPFASLKAFAPYKRCVLASKLFFLKETWT